MSLERQVPTLEIKMKRGQLRGSITVFLSMVFLLIVAVVLVTLESARVNAINTCMSMAVSQGMDSLLADYYLPLFEEYQIMGRYEEETTDGLRRDAIAEELTETLQYMVDPQEGMEESGNKKYTALNVRLEEVEVSGLKYFTDYDSGEFYSQAAQAAQFYSAQNILDQLLESCNILSDTSKASKAFSMQAEVEEELAELDEVTLSLMQLIDGVKIKDGEIKVKSNGMIAHKDSFVKQLVSMPTSMESVKVNHATVYASLQDAYIDKDNLYRNSILIMENILADYDQIDGLEEQIRNLFEEIGELEEQIEPIHSQLTQLDAEMRSLGATIQELIQSGTTNQTQLNYYQDELQRKTEEQRHIAQSLEAIESALSEKNLAVESIEQEVNDLTIEINELFSNLQIDLEEIQLVLDDCNEVLEDCLEVCEDGMKKQEEAKETVIDYEEGLSDICENLSEEIADSLSEELEQMKQYVGLSSSSEDSSESNQIVYDFESMKETIEYDQSLLQSITSVWCIWYDDSREGIQEILTTIEQNQAILRQYSIEHLEFDYSTLNLNQSEQENVIDQMKNTISQGILSLVVEDTSKLSDAEITLEGLPSTLAGVLHNSDRVETDTQLAGIEESGVGQLFGNLCDLFSGVSDLGDFADSMSDLAFFQMYIQYYFKDYTEEEDPVVETVLYPSVLSYEKEYICFHHSKDQENLADMVSTIFSLRLLVSFFELYSNSTCREKAEATAAALVAFTGLAFLVTLTKMLILIAWATIEALIDVAAMLTGKKVDVFETSQQNMAYEELLTVSKDKIIAKAKAYEKKTSIAIGYDEYLFLFLFMQTKQMKCYCMMDLIQENLNKRYEGGFDFGRCIYGVEAQVTARIDTKYAIGRSFGDGIRYTKSLALTY